MIHLYYWLLLAYLKKSLTGFFKQHIGFFSDISYSGLSFSDCAGEYAFLQFAHDKESHPFTIASSGNHADSLRFVIKELGDFTKELTRHIQIGQQVIIKGPYGEFKFEDACERQIWIAGGIGITPFLARLEYLTNHGGTEKPIDFWYCTRGDLAEQFPSFLTELCKKSGVTFHHLNSSKKEYLTLDMLKKNNSDLSKSSIWFCGPQAFSKCIQEKLQHGGFNCVNFHSDDFNMR